MGGAMANQKNRLFQNVRGGKEAPHLGAWRALQGGELPLRLGAGDQTNINIASRLNTWQPALTTRPRKSEKEGNQQPPPENQERGPRSGEAGRLRTQPPSL